MKEFSALTVFRLRDEIAGKRVKELDEFIDKSKNAASHNLRSHFGFQARLFVASPDIRRPPWLEFLEPGFGTLGQVPDSVNNSAVLVVRVKRGKRDYHFAFTFGFGRFLLRSGSYERNYGMRVALNAVYPKRDRKEDMDPNRLRSVDSKTVAANTLRTRRQTDRRTAFEDFDVDIQRDLLTGLTGTPFDESLWGRRITGADALYLGVQTEFKKLGDLCDQVERFSTKIPPEFSWVDKIYAVRDSVLVDKLKLHVIGMIRRDEVQGLELAPPELIDWGEIDKFAFSFNSQTRFEEPVIEDYVSELKRSDKLNSLAPKHLTSVHRMIAFDQAGTQIHQWPIFRCLSGELKSEKKTYLLSEGEFFEVSERYLDDLNADIARLKEFNRSLPAYVPEEEEGDYNQRVAEESDDRLLLDRKTVRLSSHTSPIEICDILTRDRALLHVKRKLNSSSLSHLFAQGLVSADLLLMSNEFRQKVRRVVITAENARGRTGRFSRAFPENRGVTPSEFTIVYAIMAKWGNRSLAEGLPFFSKINLRRCTKDLRRMGYRVLYKRISEGHH
jgi:uncharacterized protein (TIGR04141 family)